MPKYDGLINARDRMREKMAGRTTNFRSINSNKGVLCPESGTKKERGGESYNLRRTLPHLVLIGGRPCPKRPGGWLEVT